MNFQWWILLKIQYLHHLKFKNYKIASKKILIIKGFSIIPGYFHNFPMVLSFNFLKFLTNLFNILQFFHHNSKPYNTTLHTHTQWGLSNDSKCVMGGVRGEWGGGVVIWEMILRWQTKQTTFLKKLLSLIDR
jgi:hypothetical protein